MRTTSTVGSDDRAVSDVVGYVLIFSLITISVGVITVGGFSTLEDRQDAERINNAERAFDVFAANMEDIYRDGAPSRATEMRLSGGTLRYGESISIKVAPVGYEEDNITIVSNPLIYADGDTEIVYSVGAVFRSEGDSSVMLRDPPIYNTSDSVVLPIIRTYRTSGTQSFSVDGTVRVTGEARMVNTTNPAPFEGSNDYKIILESPRSDAWERYLNAQHGIENIERDGETVEAEITQKIQLLRFPIRIHISN